MRNRPQTREPLNIVFLMAGCVALGWFLANSFNFRDRAEAAAQARLANTLSQMCVNK